LPERKQSHNAATADPEHAFAAVERILFEQQFVLQQLLVKQLLFQQLVLQQFLEPVFEQQLVVIEFRIQRVRRPATGGQRGPSRAAGLPAEFPFRQ
jgi:hypothetical protein